MMDGLTNESKLPEWLKGLPDFYAIETPYEEHEAEVKKVGSTEHRA